MLRTLFIRGNCNSGAYTKIEALAGRAGAVKPRKIHIEVISENTLKPSDIQLINITCAGDCQINSLGQDSRISTLYFNELRDINFKTFGACGKMGLFFDFFNPTGEDVLIYITILGEAVPADFIGKK